MSSDAHRGASARPLVALLVAVTAVYAAVIPSGFIDYDDAWLIAESPFLRDPSPASLWRAWTAFDLGTRLVLGAEYLPLRDTVGWLIARLAGPSPTAFHLVQLGVYLGAIAALRAWLHAVWAGATRAELALWLFALHPAHVHSVAWAAGLKDALSLLFMALAMRRYARGSPPRVSAVVALSVAACLSKGTSVVLPALFLAGDALSSRAPRWRAVIAVTAVSLGSIALQARVGSITHMFSEPLGRNAFERVTSMAPVLLRYAAVSLLIEPPCIARWVAPRGTGDLTALGAMALTLALVALALRAWRRGERVGPAALWIFLAGLAPVSQLVAPLQNHMADRYLLTAVLGPCLFAAELISRAPRRPLRRALAASVVLLAAALSARHAWEFSDPERLWRDALARVPESPLPAYQLALRVEAQRDLIAAERLYREALRRDAMRSDFTPRSAVNLSRLLAVSGRADEAAALLEPVIARFTTHPRPLNNLATIRYAQGRREEARAMFLDLITRFPEYRRGRQGYSARFGPPPTPERRVADPWAFDPRR